MESIELGTKNLLTNLKFRNNLLTKSRSILIFLLLRGFFKPYKYCVITDLK